MNMPLAIAAMAEAATGIALLVAPSLVAQWLLGHELFGIALAMGRVAGIALLSLGIACWPSKEPPREALLGMITYGSIVAIYLVYLGVEGDLVGPLLWPAVALHALLTLLLTRELFRTAVQ